MEEIPPHGSPSETPPAARGRTAASPHQEGAPFDFAALYESHLGVMIGLAVGRYGVPETDAETLAHEVFVDFILKAHRVTDVRAWLVASICNASKYYTRVRARSETLPESFAEKPDPQLSRVLEMWPDQLAAREAFAGTTPRAQLVLRLRYFEGYSIPEIARELNITEKYASKLVSECLRQAKRRYEKKGMSVKP
ncbi:MAG TPA: sigma-70 family RNA polymerase sigma factor [Thermoanaerobaculia bacterium]